MEIVPETPLTPSAAILVATLASSDGGPTSDAPVSIPVANEERPVADVTTTNQVANEASAPQATASTWLFWLLMWSAAALITALVASAGGFGFLSVFAGLVALHGLLRGVEWIIDSFSPSEHSWSSVIQMAGRLKTRLFPGAAKTENRNPSAIERSLSLQTNWILPWLGAFLVGLVMALATLNGWVFLVLLSMCAVIKVGQDYAVGLVRPISWVEGAMQVWKEGQSIAAAVKMAVSPGDSSSNASKLAPSDSRPMPQKSILQSYSAVSSSVVLLCLVIVFSLAVTPSIERPSSGANSPVDLQSQATPQVVSAPPEFKYLPANSKAFVSLKVLPWLPLYRLCLDAVSADKDVTLFYGKMMEDGISQEFGIPLSHIDRVLVVFVADSHDTLTVIGTKSPVTPDDIRQTRMIRNAERSLPYRLHNAGQHTIYQEVYIPFQKIGPAPGYINGKKVEPQTKNAEPKEGDAFCIAEKNVVLFGKEALLRRILTMEQPSKLPTSIQLAIDKLDFSKPLVAAGDVATLLPDGLPPSSPLRSSIKMPRDAFSRIQVITLEAEITDAKVSAKAVLHCGSKKTAEEIKTWANEITKLLPEKLNEGVDGVPLPKAIQVLFRTSIANLTTDVSNGSLIVSTHNDTNGLAAAFWATTRLGMQANHTWSRDDLRESTKRLVSEKTKDEVLTQLGIPHETVELAGFQVWLFPNRLTEILSTGGEKDYSILIVFKNGRVIAVSFF